MGEVNLLRRYPQVRRDIAARVEGKEENRKIAMRFGREYFDAGRETGYGGYRFIPGLWRPVAEDIAEHFRLNPRDTLLDIGCAKGFCLQAIQEVVPGITTVGLDISEYALSHAHPDVHRIVRANAKQLPFPDASFDVVLAVNTLHNLVPEECVQALREIQRVARRGSYVQVDCYDSPAEEERFRAWMLTARSHGSSLWWKNLFATAQFRGDFGWTFT